ncbi:glycosyltransferase [Kaistella pullorum]|uniref:Glycosyltransferase n=1 Tax=Kaistella pullorum TaxID=2763074 RepID=A0ABR8WIZ4_9FLAO|nr:glycosyltransferase [Kaistella pullorum]MBD8017024.1 glycosyltransferase [Kaistella pullorum]
MSYKILFFIDSLGSGGAQRQIVEVAKTFKQYGHHCEFLIYHESMFFEKDLIEVKIPIKILKTRSYLQRIIACWSYIRSGDYDCVISFLDVPNFINELTSFPFRRHKIIVGERSADNNILTNRKRRLLKYFHRFANYVVSNSYSAKAIIEHIKPSIKNQRVIYNMLDLEKWTPSYGSTGTPKIRVMSAATHRQLKNARILIEAVNMLTPEERQHVKIDWYGKQSDDNSYHQNLQLINNYSLQEIISFYPPVTDLEVKIKDYNIVGLYSTTEGLPNIVCEGMAAGKVVVASAVSDVPKLLSHCMEFTFNPYRPEELVYILKTLIHDYTPAQLENIGLENRKKAITLFDKNKIYEKYLELIQ